MGIGTLFAGPLSDAFGRKRIIMFGSALYALAALACYFAPTLELLLAARIVQGIGAAAPRTVSIAMIRDLYSGRGMAQIMSFVMMIFTVIPAVAPLMGQGIIAIADWHAIFLAYIAFSAVIMLWMGLRQPETLPVTSRRPLKLATLWSATQELGRHRVIVISTLVQALTLGALFATLSSMSGIFEVRFDRAETFPLWFAFIAVGLDVGQPSQQPHRDEPWHAPRHHRHAGRPALPDAPLPLDHRHRPHARSAGLPRPYPLVDRAVRHDGPDDGQPQRPRDGACGPHRRPRRLGHLQLATVGSVLLAIPVGLAFNGTVIPLLTGVALLIASGLALMRYGLPPR
jgi:MFS transporter, DHA1 family, multidrug resistance protein